VALDVGHPKDERKKSQIIQLAVERVLDCGWTPQFRRVSGIRQTALDYRAHDQGQDPDYRGSPHFGCSGQTRKCLFCSSIGGALLSRAAAGRTNGCPVFRLGMRCGQLHDNSIDHMRRPTNNRRQEYGFAAPAA